jgi:hypothetical protein
LDSKGGGIVAYTKQTWIDGVSPISKTRMDHIEDGIVGAETYCGLNSGTFIETTELTAYGVYTKSVALGASDYKFAIAHFNYDTSNSTMGGLVIARNTIASASSILSFYMYNASMSRRTGDYLSEDSDNHHCLSGSSQIALEHMYINGSNLEFKWKNLIESVSSLKINVDWTVIR